jgi:hypothetical protein
MAEFIDDNGRRWECGYGMRLQIRVIDCCQPDPLAHSFGLGQASPTTAFGGLAALFAKRFYQITRSI